MGYGQPEGEGLDSQFDIAFACDLGHPDSDLQRNDLCVIRKHCYIDLRDNIQYYSAETFLCMISRLSCPERR